MATESNIDVAPSELAQIVASVFESMMGLELTECGALWSQSNGRLTSAVHLAGDWSGAVLLECDRGQACRFAGRFLSMDPPETVDDVVRDVLGELANMIGGNLKCILSPGIKLSMPLVVDGSDYSMRICGEAVTERLAFECGEGLFWITVATMRS